MKSWDLHVCDRASTITHVDRVKKSNPWYNKIWLCLNVTIWSSQICFSVIFIHFVMIQNIWEKKLHLFTLFSITRHCFSLFLVGSKSMLALLPFKVTITPRLWNDKCFHRAGGDLICRFCICASHFQCIVQKSEIRKRLFGIFTVRRKWLHKHALFCKFKVSQCWMQQNLLLEPCKRLNIVRKKHSQLFMSFMNFRCISSAIWSVKLPSLAVRGGTIGTFCIAATANVS